MLMLHVKREERVFITVDDVLIEVFFKEARGSTAYLGFKAPRDVKIVREFAKIKERPAQKTPTNLVQLISALQSETP
jgi:sRNA-binding carbon storage regulator CsrA